MAEAEAVYRYESGNIAHAPKKDYGPLDFTGKLGGGLRLDIRRRAPLYCSDWTDAFNPENFQKSVSSILYLFIAALAPAITFGSRFLDGTNGQFGVMEMIMSTCISGLIFSTFSGQPLSILGATGPFLAYTLVVYDLAVAVDVEFMPFYFWTCMWCSLFTVLVAVFDLCALMKHVTMFSEDIFAGLISLIFIIDGARPIIENFTESRLTLTNCMFEALLFLWTFGLATYLSSFRRSPWTFRFVRNFAANFAVTIALVSGSALAAIYSNDTGLRMLQVDADFSPNLSLSDGSKRPWIINPAGMDRPFPAWGIAYAILPAIGFAVLGYLDQNLTSVIVNRPSNGLKKPAAYHLDLFVRGALTLPVCAVLGLPLSVASTVPSITHVISLTTYEVKQLPEGERKVPTKVVEQRATNFLIHVLIGSALFLAPVLKFLPRAVLQGVFFYMGIASLTGNNLFDRLKLWLIWDPAKYPQYHYIQKLPISRVHLYTVVQVICLGILYGLKAIKETSVVFPFFMASLAIIRKAMRFMFTEDELKQLDGLPGEDEEEDASMSKPDIVNLEGKEVKIIPPLYSLAVGIGEALQGMFWAPLARDVQLQLHAGVVVFDMECIHDNPRGSYQACGLVETSNQWEWKERCQIIEFSAIDVITGESFSVRCRPQFNWQDVRSHAARRFAEDHGHREIVEDMGLPFFEEVWHSELVPFLQRAAGGTGNVVLLAHNGAALDEFVLKKEIYRLRLDMSWCPRLMYADPVAAVKQSYGNPAVAAEYRGRHMSLALAEMHQRYVGESKRKFKAHNALDDCHMLLEVLCHAPYVADALADHICHMIGLSVPHLASMLRNRLANPLNVRDPLPAPRILEHCGKRYLLKPFAFLPVPPTSVQMHVPTPVLAPVSTAAPIGSHVPSPPPTPPPENTMMPPPPPPDVPPSPPPSPPTLAPAMPPAAPVVVGSPVRTVSDVEDDLKIEDPKEKRKKKANSRGDWWQHAGGWEYQGREWWAWPHCAWDSSYDGGEWHYPAWGKGGYQPSGKGRQRGGTAKGKSGKSKAKGGKAASPVVSAPIPPTTQKPNGAESSTKAFKFQIHGERRKLTVLIFLFMLLYACAILTARCLGMSEEEMSDEGSKAEEVRVMFDGVMPSMFVLFESITCWSLMGFTPLFRMSPGSRFVAVIFYIFANWGLLAVMTGVVSEKMMATKEP
ncbi:SLC4A10 [Symbiodinium sp. CCMP2592]|nr:SLC4A10 [Symbiodinium sp. CCMP2592]